MTQTQQIEHHLKSAWLTPMQAFQWFGCMRLGARIYDLKQQGRKIREKWITLRNGKRVKAFRIA